MAIEPYNVRLRLYDEDVSELVEVSMGSQPYVYVYKHIYIYIFCYITYIRILQRRPWFLFYKGRGESFFILRGGGGEND